jgi:Zn-finger nucleic acid-binding protein
MSGERHTPLSLMNPLLTSRDPISYPPGSETSNRVWECVDGPMNCPVCREPMAILEYEDVEVDYCLACGGIWLDAGEIELLFGDEKACADFLTIGSPADAKGEKPRRCPICRAKMTKEATESDPPTIFDNCPNGDGLWFDKGELVEILQHGKGLGGKGEVPAFLRGVFMEEKNE